MYYCFAAKKIGYAAFALFVQNPQYAKIINADESRLIAEVVSGIGFLGAGTIVIVKQDTHGLTTAASIWLVAIIGLAIGIGDYRIASTGTVVVLLVLIVFKKLFHFQSSKKVLIEYWHRKETREFIQNYFVEHKIVVLDVIIASENQLYSNEYELEIPPEMSYAEIVEDLSMNENIKSIKMVSS
ncbi:MgtC/SapB family protein [Xylocopilactobacillus apicola]|uniref:MgtC/SapB/SrpB/YhiD N-terminal domain-containing protein n=1 Tax=Xylocopilactobacillus apicola TaxID=2932184 RepID=A0AAU9DKJ6_9LACO|nr:MgtC/SapB family protein [Xylocopilactobacillus apicola]BDR59071.1 hypothetical protein XA3_15120 [Xylocopilactobacillus apicola]